MPKGQKNLYRCQECLDALVTLDMVDGTTPFMLSCHVTPTCTGAMFSSFYQCDQRLPHQYEWFKPDRLDGYDADMLEHIRKGGLVIRRRDINPDSVRDVLLRDAIGFVRSAEAVSIVRLQRQFKVGYGMAARLVDHMIMYGIIFPARHKAGEHFVVQEIDWSQNGKHDE